MIEQKAIREMFMECVAGSQSACESFFLRCQPIFRRVAARIAHQYRSPDEVDDLVQEICLKVSTPSANLAVKLPLDPNKTQAYLSTLAANVARDWFRARGARPVTVPTDAHLPALAEILGVKPEHDRQLLIQQMEEALVSDQRSRTIFQLYYRQGFSALEIASIPAFGLSVKGVESLLLRVRESLKLSLGIGKGARAHGPS